MSYIYAEGLVKQYGTGEAVVTAVGVSVFRLTKVSSWPSWENQVQASRRFSPCWGTQFADLGPVPRKWSRGLRTDVR